MQVNPYSNSYSSLIPNYGGNSAGNEALPEASTAQSLAVQDEISLSPAAIAAMQGGQSEPKVQPLPFYDIEANLDIEAEAPEQKLFVQKFEGFTYTPEGVFPTSEFNKFIMKEKWLAAHPKPLDNRLDDDYGRLTRELHSVEIISENRDSNPKGSTAYNELEKDLETVKSRLTNNLASIRRNYEYFEANNNVDVLKYATEVFLKRSQKEGGQIVKLDKLFEEYSVTRNEDLFS